MSKDNIKSGNKPLGLVSWIILIVCAIVFIGSAAHLLFYAKDKIQAENKFKSLRESSRDLSELYAQNSDLIGWIEVPGTKIDYPVMQTPGDVNYYLHNDFDKQPSVSGTPYLDALSVVEADNGDIIRNGSGDVDSDDDGQLDTSVADEGTFNWLIYGHNMKIGTMFHDLVEYDSEDFWNEHKTFTFDVYNPNTGKTERGTYEIFAASRSEIKAENSTEFKYYRFAGYTDEQHFNEYVVGVKSESSYDTGITPEYGEQLITLSTCAYHAAEGRMYIVGHRVK